MTQAALSAAQFGDGGSAVEPLHQPVPDDGGTIPLPYGSNTNTSAKQAAAWRKPRANLPLSQATTGSLFQPFSNTPE